MVANYNPVQSLFPNDSNSYMDLPERPLLYSEAFERMHPAPKVSYSFKLKVWLPILLNKENITTTDVREILRLRNGNLQPKDPLSRGIEEYWAEKSGLIPEVAKQNIAYATLEDFLSVTSDSLTAGISRPLNISEIEKELIQIGKRKVVSTPNFYPANDECIHYILSYRHASKWDDEGTISKQTARLASELIHDSIPNHNVQVRIWVDQLLHINATENPNWHEVGLVPYSCLPVIVSYTDPELPALRP